RSKMISHRSRSTAPERLAARRRDKAKPSRAATHVRRQAVSPLALGSGSSKPSAFACTAPHRRVLRESICGDKGSVEVDDQRDRINRGAEKLLLSPPGSKRDFL